MDEYPKMMFKDGGSEIIHGRPLLTFVVASHQEEQVAISEGWRDTTHPSEVVQTKRRGRPPKALAAIPNV